MRRRRSKREHAAGERRRKQRRAAEAAALSPSPRRVAPSPSKSPGSMLESASPLEVTCGWVVGVCDGRRGERGERGGAAELRLGLRLRRLCRPSLSHAPPPEVSRLHQHTPLEADKTRRARQTFKQSHNSLTALLLKLSPPCQMTVNPPSLSDKDERTAALCVAALLPSPNSSVNMTATKRRRRMTGTLKPSRDRPTKRGAAHEPPSRARIERRGMRQWLMSL